MTRTIKSQSPVGPRGALNYDVIVIGAGANGAGIARDAAARGLRVLLLEKEDVSSGTSSWNGRLIHGGLRYLEQMDVRLVRESLRERERLFRHAPHLVKPIPFLMPFYSKNKRPAWMIRLGMLAFDVLSYDKTPPMHKILGRDRAIARLPSLSPSTLTGAAVYIDGQVEMPERLCVELAVAAAADGAAVRTHTCVEELIVDRGAVRGVRFIDRVTGERGEAFASVVLNVAGPWVDRVLMGLGEKRLIGGTKGSHIVVDRFPDAPQDVVYYESQTDQRLVLVIPWNGRLLIGTTDIRYDQDPDEVKADEAEVDYLLKETNNLIPTARLTRDSVLYTFSGVRPLPYVPGKTEGKLPRSHVIYDHRDKADGLLSMVGGKLTTYRSLAQDAVDATFRKLDRNPPPCMTQHMPFPGARVADLSRYRDEFIAWSGLEQASATRLVDLYGSRAKDVVAAADGSPELLAALPGQVAIGAELVFAFEQEFARTLTDVFMRRTMLGLEPGHGLDAVERSAQILGDRYGWDSHRRAAEIEAYRRYLRRFEVPGRQRVADDAATARVPATA